MLQAVVPALQVFHPGFLTEHPDSAVSHLFCPAHSVYPAVPVCILPEEQFFHLFPEDFHYSFSAPEKESHT